MAESCAERGYAASSVADVAKRAGVSTASFYRQFKGKRECMLASFAELFGRLLEGLEGSCVGMTDGTAKARKGAAAAAELLASDPPTARLLSVEILAVGAEGVRVQHEAIERFAALLRHPSAAEPERPDAAWAAAAAMVSLTGRRAAEGDAPSTAEFEALAAVS
jgi:AcrR family transcriptional regulator